MEIITMQRKRAFRKPTYRTFKVYDDGSAKENATLVEDFTALYMDLVGCGWSVVSDTVAPSDRKTVKQAIHTRDMPTFRDGWNEYLTEYSDNLELEFA